MKKRILVVDDDTMNLLRTKRILEDEYDVLLVDSGHKALDKLERERLDLVLLDIEMPKMNGFETFERMKGIAAGVPVTREEIAALGEGGLCLGCERCTYPNCGFGK